VVINKFSPRRAMNKIMALAPEREIFLRSSGKVHFLRISTRVQIGFALALLLALGGWGIATGAMLWSQVNMSVERARLERERAAVIDRQASVDAYRGSVSDIAREIEARQEAMEEIMRVNLGAVPAATESAPAKDDAPKAGTTSSLMSDTQRLHRLRDEQAALESSLADAAKARLGKVEQAIRSFGLNPSSLGVTRRGGMGGPYEPVRGLIASDPDLRELATLLGRLSAMEATLAAIPSGRPTAAPMETSSYGYRRDPFNGRPAFHSGIDFPGHHGQQILAAASGKVSFVGRRQGYGNVIEVTHGNAMMTRYAHLSRATARVGDKVARGQAIARMGSTGRSTGTHLHFEVRVNGAAVNPRRFLEARQDVLEIQQIAKQRVRASGRG
jgi:murein DD-endopeptidase MepM/ murein hydrolase activator NlpD